MVNVKEITEHWAYDISKNVISKGEIYDTEVINQSIEMILTTMYNERLFNTSFGSTLPGYLFETINEQSGEKLLDDCVKAVSTWEDRVAVISQLATLQIIPDQNAIILNLPYVIKQNGTTSNFVKKINF